MKLTDWLKTKLRVPWMHTYPGNKRHLETMSFKDTSQNTIAKVFIIYIVLMLEDKDKRDAFHPLFITCRWKTGICTAVIGAFLLWSFAAAPIATASMENSHFRQVCFFSLDHFPTNEHCWQIILLGEKLNTSTDNSRDVSKSNIDWLIDWLTLYL